jgi:roadblock/LC7 domain-containing protein
MGVKDMRYIGKLMKMPGVIAAGYFTYKGEIRDYMGSLSKTEAQRLAAMCYANLRMVRMQGNMLEALTAYKPNQEYCGLHSANGWIVRGAQKSICVVSDSFCILNNIDGSLNAILHLMLNETKEAQDHLI